VIAKAMFSVPRVTMNGAADLRNECAVEKPNATQTPSQQSRH
jgi:hypothetical protein